MVKMQIRSSWLISGHSFRCWTWQLWNRCFFRKNAMWFGCRVFLGCSGLVMSGNGWLYVVICGYWWLRVFFIDDGWSWVVMGWLLVVIGGFGVVRGWIWVVLCWLWVFLGWLLQCSIHDWRSINWSRVPKNLVIGDQISDCNKKMQHTKNTQSNQGREGSQPGVPRPPPLPPESSPSGSLPLEPLSVGGFLFSKISETPIVHVPKLFPLLYWFQNTFCFLSSSTPSHVGKKFSSSMGISMGKSPKK